MGKCYIDSINDKFVLNGSNIAFNEFTKYKNGKILTLEGVEIIDSTLLSRLTVSGGKLALDGILVNGLDLGNISANIIPSADTMYNLGSTTRRYLRGYFGEVNTSTINLDTGSITYDGTNSVLKLGNDIIATREWVNSSAIPTLKTINGEVITGTGDITIVGSGSSGQTYMDIQYGYMAATITSIAPGVIVPFATTTNNGTLDYTAKVDDSTILIKAGVLYKLEGQVSGIIDDDASFAAPIVFGLYSDKAGNNLIKQVDMGTEYLSVSTNLIRAFSATSYIKSDVDCYLKGKFDASTVADSSGISLIIRNTLTKYNTTPNITTGTIELPSYSTEETLTEKRWIDGKPIYRKVITYVPAAVNTSYTIDTVLTSTNCQIVNSNIVINDDSGQYDKTTSANPAGYCGISNAGVYFATNMSGAVGKTHYIWLEYTKTTDTAKSPTALIQGVVSNKKYFARISNGTATSFLRGTTTQIPLSTFVKGDQELHNGTSGFIAPQDDVYTITGKFFSTTSTQANVNEITLICYVNGVEEERAWVGAYDGYNKGCNITVNTRLKKNDVVTFTLQCWTTDTTTSLSVPVGSLVATIRN